MNNSLLVFLGAGIGGVFRYWFSLNIYFLMGKQFHYGTLIINVTGCFLIGLLFVLMTEQLNYPHFNMRAFFLIGLLGGYTTFSAFSMEIIQLLENGNVLGAFLNIFLSFILCLLGNWAGVWLGRQTGYF